MNYFNNLSQQTRKTKFYTQEEWVNDGEHLGIFWECLDKNICLACGEKVSCQSNCCLHTCECGFIQESALCGDGAEAMQYNADEIGREPLIATALGINIKCNGKTFPEEVTL